MNTIEEGGSCLDEDCDGIYQYVPGGEGCACHINPPCWSCENSFLECNQCGHTE